MTKTQALANWSNVYRSVLCSREVKPYNLEVAIQYGAMDMLNLTKGMTEEAAAYLINDDAAYMTEKMAKEAA
jgi:hypothetical protein